MKNAMQQTGENRRNAENHPPYAVPKKWAKTTLMMAVCLAGTLGFADTAFAQPDPAVVAINFKLLEKDTEYPDSRGRVQIEGVVKNVGDDVYARPGLVILYENRRIVRSVPFNFLLPGEEIYVRYERSWDTSIEFSPSYTVRIWLGPDSDLGDELGLGFDADYSNNSRTRSGYDINDLFTSYILYDIPREWLSEPRKFFPRFFPRF